MKGVIFFILGIVAVVLVIVFFGNRISYLDDQAVTYCLENNHTVENRVINDDTITVCNFEFGGWCEVNDYHAGSCGVN